MTGFTNNTGIEHNHKQKQKRTPKWC